MVKAHCQLISPEKWCAKMLRRALHQGAPGRHRNGTRNLWNNATARLDVSKKYK